MEVPRKRDPEKPIGPTPLVLTGEAKRVVQDEICGRIAEGEPLAVICRDDGMPKWRTVYDWIRDDEGFAKNMEAARLMGYDAIAEEALQIADTTEEGVEIEISDNGTKEKRGDMLGHRKLRVETRLKLLAKWHPKKYGDRVDLNHGGQSGNPLVIIKDLTGRKDEEAE